MSFICSLTDKWFEERPSLVSNKALSNKPPFQKASKQNKPPAFTVLNFASPSRTVTMLMTLLSNYCHRI